MPPKYLGLSAKERIVLHLFYTGMPGQTCIPLEATERGIAESTGVQYKHVSRELEYLMKKNMVEEKLEHIRGGAKQQNAYFITHVGASEASKIIARISDCKILLKRCDGISIKGSISDMRKKLGPGFPLSRLIMGIDSNGVFDERLEEYRAVLLEVWRDGILTEDERSLLDKIARSMGITHRERKILESEIKKGEVRSGMDRIQLYEDVLRVVLRDGDITKDEAAILKLLWGRLGITGNIHESVLEKLARDAKV